MSDWIEHEQASRAACLEEWPEAVNGAYNPRCCRWPKSCSVETPPFHPHDPAQCPRGLALAECLAQHRPIRAGETDPVTGHVWDGLRWRVPQDPRVEQIVQRVLIEHQRRDIKGCGCGRWGSDHGNLGESHGAHVLAELRAAGLEVVRR